MINPTKLIQIEGNSYVIPAITPGHIIDIESNKIQISSGQYAKMILSNTKTGNIALDIIETIAFFFVLIPTIQKDMRLESLFNLDMVNMKKLIDIYKKELKPHYDAHTSLLSEVETETTE